MFGFLYILRNLEYIDIVNCCFFVRRCYWYCFIFICYDCYCYYKVILFLIKILKKINEFSIICK